MRSRPPLSEQARTIEGFREYLRLLAGLQLSAGLAGQVDLSGVVQETLLEAYQIRDRLPTDPAEQAAWLRRALANNLTDEIRRRGGRGRARVTEQSLQQAIETSSAQMEARLASAESTPSRV